MFKEGKRMANLSWGIPFHDAATCLRFLLTFGFGFMDLIKNGK